MSTTLNATTAAGFQVTSDNSGTVQFQSSGTNTMYIDASGNVGIGTSSPSEKLSVAGAANVFGSWSSTGGVKTQIFSSDATGGGGIGTVSNTFMGLYTNNAERMRIDTSGNVGIGTSSPSKKLEVYAAANSLQILSVVRNDNTGTGVAAIGFNTSGSASSEATSTKAGIGLIRGFTFGGGALAFYNNNSGAAGDFTTADEKMRLDVSGNLLVGTTNTDPIGAKVAGSAINNSGQFNFMANGGRAGAIGRYTSTGDLLQFYYYGAGLTGVGAISTNGTTTSYNTTSDYRLKENVTSLTTGLATISALKPVNYDWISDNSHGEGFIAHDLQAVIPNAVTGIKDAVDANGKPVYQGVDYSKIVVHLVAALQELKAEFDAYKASHA
jgi:hypothetical protein